MNLESVTTYVGLATLGCVGEALAATVVATAYQSTPITTTGLPFRIGVGTDGMMSVQLIA